MTYHWNRWRNEDGSAFISEDPARDGANWYGYAGQNPMVYTDPTGLAPYLNGIYDGPYNPDYNPGVPVEGPKTNPNGMPQNQTPNITGTTGEQTPAVPNVETDGKYSSRRLNAGFNSIYDTIKNRPIVKRMLSFITACEYKFYADVCVGGGISADALGFGIGGDIGSEHATFSLKIENGEKVKFDYQESMSIGIEALVTLEGSTPTPEYARSFTSPTQEEPPANGKTPIENMQYSFSYGPVSTDKDGITLNLNAGLQIILGIEVGIEMNISWEAWTKLWSN